MNWLNFENFVICQTSTYWKFQGQAPLFPWCQKNYLHSLLLFLLSFLFSRLNILTVRHYIASVVEVTWKVNMGYLFLWYYFLKRVKIISAYRKKFPLLKLYLFFSLLWFFWFDLSMEGNFPAQALTLTSE